MEIVLLHSPQVSLLIATLHHFDALLKSKDKQISLL